MKRSGLASVLAVLLAVPACFGQDVNPIEEDPGEAGVVVEVVA